MIEEGLLNQSLDRGMYEPVADLKKMMQASEALEITIIYTKMRVNG